MYPGNYCTSSSGTNCAYVFDSNSYPYFRVNTYANEISNASGILAMGRLMKLEEANSLSTNIRKDMNGNYYWLGSARSNNAIWYVSIDGNIGCYNGFSPSYAQRPVIVISTQDMP